jgi:hypothetical protein
MDVTRLDGWMASVSCITSKYALFPPPAQTVNVVSYQLFTSSIL